MNHPADIALGPSLTDQVVEAMEGGIVVLDSSGRVLAWNRWMARSSGITAADAFGRELTAVFPAIVGTRLWSAIQDALVMGVSGLLTQGLNPSLFPLRYRDGRELLHSVAVRSLRGKVEGEVLCLVQVSDVTANVQREQLLRERRDARHRAVVDTAADSIITTDPEGIIQWVNPTGERQFGYAAAELEGKNIGLLLGGDVTRWMEAATSTPGAVPPWLTGRRKDGSLIDLELSLGQWQSGGRSYVTGILRDVTERRREQERLRLAVEGAGMATWDFDLASGSAVWSRHHFVLLGYDPNPTGAATLDMWESRLHPDDRDAVQAEWARAEREKDMCRVVARIHRANDGAQRWLEAFGRFMQDGGSRRFIGVLFDVTERKTAEEHQRLLMREVDHRAKNALAVVRSVLRLTRSDDPRRFAEAVEGRVAALARAHTLLAQDLWTGAGLRAVVEQELAPYSGGGRISISGDSVRLRADAVQPLSMALHELATNAAKYGALSDPGGRVEVSWQQEPATGTVRLRWAELDGPPILAPPERRGFGSTLVESVVRGQLGGQADVHWHTEGLVCELTIGRSKIIPEIASPFEQTSSETAVWKSSGFELPAISLRGRRILVVEDEPVVAMELHQLLARLGCEVIGPAGTLDEAMALASSSSGSSIDVGILDVNLHGQTCYPLADLLATRGVPVVYTSGYGELPEGRAARDNAVLLCKPVSDRDLGTALRRALALIGGPSADQHPPAERKPMKETSK
jgi:PAS domain S-box-containing protein